MSANPDPTAITPFTAAASHADLADLRERLARTRWPDPETVDDRSQGVPLATVRDLADHWAGAYDWRATEARLNSYPQFTTVIDGVEIHFLHVRSRRPGALPLLVTHGWPGGVVEELDIVDALVDPPDPADAFDVVIPSLPGFGFSGKPRGTGWDIARVASAWVELMRRLGHDRFAAHGGDWGSYVSATLGVDHPDRLVGIHLTQPIAARPAEPVELDAADQQRAANAGAIWRVDSGYASIQSTKPQTLGYGLHDSPVGQLAWVAEKFWEWTDHDGDVEKVISRDRILDSVTLSWLTGSATSAARLYWESYNKTTTAPVHVPTGCSIFPANSWMPRAWCELRFTDLRHWRDLDAGGHFPALETPDVLVAELREFFRGLRPTG